MILHEVSQCYSTLKKFTFRLLLLGMINFTYTQSIDQPDKINSGLEILYDPEVCKKQSTIWIKLGIRILDEFQSM